MKSDDAIRRFATPLTSHPTAITSSNRTHKAFSPSFSGSDNCGCGPAQLKTRTTEAPRRDGEFVVCGQRRERGLIVAACSAASRPQRLCRCCVPIANELIKADRGRGVLRAMFVKDLKSHISSTGTRFSFAVCLLVATARPVLADKWMSPERKTVVSQNGTWSALMTPGRYGRATAKLEVVHRASANRAGGWARAPVNTEAPVDLFVSDAGAVVTLGDWHQEGYEHSIVIYDSKGNIVIDWRLEDFLTKSELERTSRSVSSRWWRYPTEKPRLVGGEFSVTTRWGTTLRFNVGTGRVSRDLALPKTVGPFDGRGAIHGRHDLLAVPTLPELPPLTSNLA